MIRTITRRTLAPPATRRAHRAMLTLSLALVLWFTLSGVVTTPQLLAQVVCGSATPGVTVALRPGAALTARLSTNVEFATQLNPASDPHAAGTLAALSAWNPPLVRLHFGFRGATYSLPVGGAPDAWDFSGPDAAISQLRDAHVGFFLNVRSAPPWMFNSAGQPRDPTFHEFAAYMARLVGWYDAGGFTDEAGNWHASGHQGWVTTWEIWNEPESGYEIPAPVANRAAQWMDPATFARLYTVVATAMRAVDPTIQIGGPALGNVGYADYLRVFLSDVRAPLAFVSAHFYATGDLNVPDGAILGAASTTLSADLGMAAAALRETGHGATPLWLDEMNLNARSTLPIDPRASGALGMAFAADAFVAATTNDAALVNQFSLISDAQLGLLDIATGQPYRALWLYERLGQAFPAGARRVAITTTLPGLVALGAIAPDRASLRVLLINQRAAQPGDVNGVGVPLATCVAFQSASGDPTINPAALASVWTMDGRAAATPAPVATSSWIPTVGQPQTFWRATLPGYGVTEITIPLIG